MMDALWLVNCAPEEYSCIAQELCIRDPRARFLRFSQTQDMEHFAQSFEFAGRGAALALSHNEQRNIVECLRTLTDTGRFEQRIVFGCVQEPQTVTALFQSGATEVIDVGAHKPAFSLLGAHTEGNPCVTSAGPQHLRDDTEASEVSKSDDFPDSIVERYAAAPPLLSCDSSENICVVEGALASGGRNAATRTSASVQNNRVRALEESFPTGEMPVLSSPSNVRPPAPVIVAASGRGGVGKTTLLAAMACVAARGGLRVAVLDLDLMFGNMHKLFGREEACDLALLKDARASFSDRMESSAMRIGPGVTLWGPAAAPESAELIGKPCQELLGQLRRIADVIFVDTSTFWGDAAAHVLAACDRCLIVAAPCASSCSSAARAISFIERLGVARTKMTGIVNRWGSKECGEEFALRLELAMSLTSKARIADGGTELSEMLSFGQINAYLAGKQPFAVSVRDLVQKILRELGCTLSLPSVLPAQDTRSRIRLPWKKVREAS